MNSDPQGSGPGGGGPGSNNLVNNEDRMKRSARGAPKASTGAVSDASRPVSAASAQNHEQVKEVISTYFQQLTQGCGRSQCTNCNCRSSPNFRHAQNLSSNEAAAKAVDLWRENGIRSLCEETLEILGGRGEERMEEDSDGGRQTRREVEPMSQDTEVSVCESPHLSLAVIARLVEQCSPTETWTPLIRALGHVFSSVERLLHSFLKERPCGSVPEKSELELSEKEQRLGAVGGEKEDEEVEWRTAVQEAVAAVTLDVPSFQEAMKLLASVSTEFYLPQLHMAVRSLCSTMATELRIQKDWESEPDLINVFLILFDLLLRFDLEPVLPDICRALSALPFPGQARLARIWSVLYRDSLLEMEKQLQQRITIRCLTVDWDYQKTLNTDKEVADCARVLRVIFAASLLAGEMDPRLMLTAEQEMNTQFETSLTESYRQAGYTERMRNTVRQDPLMLELNLRPNDCRRPLIPSTEFINETLNENLSVDRDYIAYKTEAVESVSFMEFPFLLTTSTKNVLLYLDNRLRMLQERRAAGAVLIQQLFGTPPYLKLRVSRERVVEDALISLEITSIESPADLKKQLYVEFVGEAGVDEGGLSKEFFQLVVERLFNPDYGMFVFDDVTRCFWFNPSPVDDMEREYVLIGIVLGLAIYNHIILDIQFPPVLYRKLMGKLGRLPDLAESHPSIHRSLMSMLEFDPTMESASVEDTFGCTFRISYPNMFGEVINHDLMPNGDQVPVTAQNRHKFAELYADFLLNSSIERQFTAFRRGFQMVVDESPLYNLFQPQELELLVCGSRVFNFSDLERVTQYEGYTADTPIIRQFWDIVHRLPESMQRQLLQFTTGSDRVPLEGMGKMRFVIARQGPDSDRLPTSHTCFNVLLLPDYSNSEKLKERLLKAISYSKGFGMI